MAIEPQRKEDLLKRKAYYQGVLHKDATSPVFFNLAAVLMQLGEMQEAEDVLDKGLVYHHKCPQGHILFAHLLVDKGEFAKAESYLQVALEVDPYNLEAHFEKARMLEESGKLIEGELVYERILAEDPNNRRARKALAQLRSRRLLGEYEGMVFREDAERTEVPEEGAVDKEELATLALVDIYFKQGHLEKAESIARRILEEDPENVPAAEFLQKIEAQIAEQELPEGSLTLELTKDYAGLAPEEMVYEEVDITPDKKDVASTARRFGTGIHPASSAPEVELPDIEELKERLEIDLTTSDLTQKGVVEEVFEVDIDSLFLGEGVPEIEAEAEAGRADELIAEKPPSGDEREVEQEVSAPEREPEVTVEKPIPPPEEVPPETRGPQRDDREVELPEPYKMLELEEDETEDIETFQQWLDRLTRE